MPRIIDDDKVKMQLTLAMSMHMPLNTKYMIMPVDNFVQNIIQNATVGEVVRCKDCKHWHESIFLRGEQGQRVGLCDCTMSMRDTDFFCKAGEKERRCQD